jgi:hypothetical protein
MHKTVNHKRHFVDPVTGATTNHIESLWQKAKMPHKARYGTHRSTLNSHMISFVWRQNFKNNLRQFIDDINELYVF